MLRQKCIARRSSGPAAYVIAGQCVRARQSRRLPRDPGGAERCRFRRRWNASRGRRSLSSLDVMHYSYRYGRTCREPAAPQSAPDAAGDDGGAVRRAGPPVVRGCATVHACRAPERVRFGNVDAWGRACGPSGRRSVTVRTVARNTRRCMPVHRDVPLGGLRGGPSVSGDRPRRVRGGSAHDVAGTASCIPVAAPSARCPSPRARAADRVSGLRPPRRGPPRVVVRQSVIRFACRSTVAGIAGAASTARITMPAARPRGRCPCVLPDFPSGRSLPAAPCSLPARPIPPRRRSRCR